MAKTSFALILIYIFSCGAVFAGTTQIYSPAGLPKSSSQEYTIPDTTVTPQTFPTPPLPLQGGISGFSSIPLREELTTGSQKAKTQSTNRSIDNQPATNGRIEDFFQVSSSVALPYSDRTQKNQPVTPNPGKFFWHVLDNLGVPLPISNKEDLDPSLRLDNIARSRSVVQPSAISPIHQRIPASELGVTDIPISDDAKLH